jgi:hypothetical protein
MRSTFLENLLFNIYILNEASRAAGLKAYRVLHTCWYDNEGIYIFKYVLHLLPMEAFTQYTCERKFRLGVPLS